MEKVTILTVTEGPSDKPIIRKVCEHIAKNEGKPIEVRPLRPQTDSTTGTSEAYGWTGVRRWCKYWGYNKPAGNSLAAISARRKNIAALLAYADYLLIQIDTDIAEVLNDLPARFNPQVDCRKNYTHQTVLHWLGVTNLTEEVYIVLSTQSIENWILATFPPEHTIFRNLPAGFNYEEVTNAEELLANSGEFPTKRKNQRLKLAKSEHHYEEKADLIVQNFSAVEKRCSDFKDFTDTTRALIRNKL